MKILFGTDGSKAALAALQTLVARYAWFAAIPNLTLVHVHPPVPYGMAARWVGKDTVAQYCAEESAKALAPATALLDAAGIAHDTVARVGEPAHEIVQWARDRGYDCIALGTHGHTALGTLVLGSIAQKVIASSAIPVLLLK